MPITIKSSIDGFRRAGMAHSKEAVTHPDGTFTEAQIKQLEAEPRISVTITEDVSNPPSSDNQNSGTMDSDRLCELVAHIASLDKDDETIWMDNNAPKVAAMPDGTKADERDLAWDAYRAQLDSAED